MARKNINNGVAVNIKKLSFTDLCALYNFVSGLNNATFGKRVQTKTMLRSKLAEVENELYSRVFGANPFTLDEKANEECINIKGEDPIKVIESFNKTVTKVNG